MSCWQHYWRHVLGFSVCLSSPVEESSLAQQQLHHLGVPLFGSQMERSQASLVPLVKQTGVCNGLQQPVARIDAAVPGKNQRNASARERPFFPLCYDLSWSLRWTHQAQAGERAATARFTSAIECLCSETLKIGRYRAWTRGQHIVKKRRRVLTANGAANCERT